MEGSRPREPRRRMVQTWNPDDAEQNSSVADREERLPLSSGERDGRAVGASANNESSVTGREALHHARELALEPMKRRAEWTKMECRASAADCEFVRVFFLECLRRRRAESFS